MKEIQEIVRRIGTPGGSWVLATLVTVEGSSYRRAGARALLGPSPAPTRFGSISGGCLEDDIAARAERVAETGQAELALYDTTSENDLVWGVGLGCHGVVQVLLEPLAAAPLWAGRAAAAFAGGPPCDLATVWDAGLGLELGTRTGDQVPDTLRGAAGIFWQRLTAPTALWIFGAGDDAQPLARMAAELGWAVTVADPRPAYARPERFPDAARVIAGSVAELLRAAGAAEPDLAVIMTHHYVHDRPLLQGLTGLPLLYLGLLGPRQRADRLLDEIAPDSGEQREALAERLHAPVGLDLGAEGAEEVALSILAEMLAKLAGRNARPLRERRHPIHHGAG